MDSIQINDIIKRSILELASIGITGIYDILSVEDSDLSYDGFEVINGILLDTYDRFEYLEPLVLQIRCNISSNRFEFIDNFDRYIDGSLQEEYIELIPRVVLSLSNQLIGSLKGIKYQPPHLYSNIRGCCTFNCIVNRPIKIERSGNKYSDSSRIYYLGEYNKPQLVRFRNLFLLNLSKHLIRLNENLQHPNLPIEVFQGLNNLVSDLTSKVENDFEISHGYYGIYTGL